MTEREFLAWLMAALVAAPIAAWGLTRACRWLAARGYLIDEKTRKPGGISNAAMELQKLYAPSIEHRIEAEDSQVERADNDGD